MKQNYITLNDGNKIPQFGLGVYMIRGDEGKSLPESPGNQVSSYRYRTRLSKRARRRFGGKKERYCARRYLDNVQTVAERVRRRQNDESDIKNA